MPSNSDGKADSGLPPEVQTAALVGVAAAMGVARRIQRLVEPRPDNSSGMQNPARSDASFLKRDASPVTVGDFAVQAIVAHHLELSLGTNLRLIGEESSASLRSDAAVDRAETRRAVIDAVRTACPDLDERDVLRTLDLGTARPARSEWWLIDPIDGTKGFLRGQHYCIALALVRDGAVRFAVMGCPNLDEDPSRALADHPAQGAIFVATSGGGCTVRLERTPTVVAANVRRPTELGPSIRVCESVEPGPVTHSRVTALIDRACAHSGRPAEGLRLDSQCKYGLVARGQADVYLRLPRRSIPVENAWDHAAGALIAAEGGAWVSDLDGKPLDFSRGMTLDANRGVLSCDRALAEPLLDAIRATRAAEIPSQPGSGTFTAEPRRQR